jgi:sugar-specific transcriptional regulator TrmB
MQKAGKKNFINKNRDLVPMDSFRQHSETLIKLGLSPNEARVYLGTLKTGVATAKTIAKNSVVGREDVYRVLPALQELGLVRKYLGAPAKYEAIAPDEAIKILLCQREEENVQLKNQASEFLQMCYFDLASKVVEDEKTVIVSRDNKTGVDSELIRLIRDTKQTLDFTTRVKLFFTAFNEPGLTDWINEMYAAAQRGVKFRMIMEKPDVVTPMSEYSFYVPNSKRLLTHPNFDYRYVSTPPECIMVLFDKHASCIETSCLQLTKMSPYLITNNPVFAALNKAYFELLWEKAVVNQKTEKIPS